MLELCHYFGGSEDIKRAKKVENILKSVGREIPDELIKECCWSVVNNGSADYLGEIFCYAVECLADDLREAVGIYADVEENCYPNYISSSGSVQVKIDESTIDVQEDIDNLVPAIERVLNKWQPFLNDFRIDLIFTFEDKEVEFNELPKVLQNYLTTKVD